MCLRQVCRKLILLTATGLILLPATVRAEVQPNLACTKENLMEQHDWQLFFQACDKALNDAAPDSDRRSELYYLRGYGLYSLRDMEKAYRDFQQVLKLNPKHMEVRDVLPYVVLALGGTYLDAAKFLHDALLSKPQRARTHYGLAYLAQTQGDFKQAMKYFDRAVELNPNFAWARHRRSRLSEALRQWDKVLTDTGYIASNKGQFGKIAKHELFQRKVDLHVVAVVDHGHALGQLGRFKEAEAWLDKLVADEKSAVAYAARAQTLKGMPFGADVKPRFDDAIRDAREAIKLDPEMSEGYRQLGHLLSFVGKPKEAIKQQLKAISLHRKDFDSPNLYWELAESQRQLGQTEDAIGSATQAISLASQYNANFLNHLMSRLTTKGYFQQPKDQSELYLAFTDAVTACMHDVQC